MCFVRISQTIICKLILIAVITFAVFLSHVIYRLHSNPQFNNYLMGGLGDKRFIKAQYILMWIKGDSGNGKLLESLTTVVEYN